ncbi:MAG TPA: FecR family protein [Treponemataceae bacterium]|nr:FecR family protein [Treponemataceae bacterium]
MRKIVCACALVAALSALEAQVIGRVEFALGSSQLTRNARKLPLAEIGTPVENLDLVSVPPDGELVIAFDKSTGLSGTLTIEGGSTVCLRLERLGGKPTHQVELLAGSVGVKVKRLAGSSSAAQVRAPTAVLGVRGTEFVVASFNGTVLVACEVGEVFCSPSDPETSGQAARAGSSAVPGRMVEVLETGKVNSAAFPKGDFDANWEATRARWREFQVGIVASDPASLLGRLAPAWTASAQRLAAARDLLARNRVLTRWLAAAAASDASGVPAGTMADWARERPEVMRDLIAVRPDLVVGMVRWYRIAEILPHIPESEYGRRLADGRTIGEFARDFRAGEEAASAAFDLFAAAEKEYLRRNDGESPFSSF